MDRYLVWFDLRDTRKDVEFSKAVDAYLGHLTDKGLIEGYNLMRRKLGFGPPTLGEFMIEVRTEDLAQLDRAFDVVSPRSGEVERLHAAVFSAVKDSTFALYRDFPDANREGA